MQFQQQLQAGQHARQWTAGSMFVLVDAGAAGVVEVALYRGNQELERVEAKRGFKARVPGGFTALEFRAAVAGLVKFVVSDGLVDFDSLDGASVQATIVNEPLQVVNDRGTPGNLLHVTAVTVADTPAVALANLAAVACGPVQVQVAAADAARRALRLTNIGADPVALGAGGITWANRCIILAPGDTFIEDRAANLAWWAITDAGKAASVTAQAVSA